MKKVFIGVGHGGSNPGALGILVEKTINLEMALACRDFLVANNVNVLMSREKDEKDPLTDEIKECNSYNPDLALDIHNNSGGGDGFEVFYHYKGGKSKELAENIEKEVIKIGQNSRGCKIKLNSQGSDYFGFIREINAPSVICEGVFVDSKSDTQIADQIDEQRKFGIAYAKGVLKTLGLPIISQKTITEQFDDQKIYRVQVGAFKIHENARNTLEKIKKLGFSDAFITTK